MSKADITAVATLAAHLALKDAETVSPHTDLSSPRSHAGSYAADAMQLQRLGRRATRALDKLENLNRGKPDIVPGRGIFSPEEFALEQDRIREEVMHILKPYGLDCELRDEPFRAECLYILGLPGNTPCTDGFCI